MPETMVDNTDTAGPNQVAWLALRRAYDSEILGSLLSAGAAVVLAGLVWGHSPGGWIPAGWMLLMMAATVLRVAMARRFQHHAVAGNTASWTRRHTLTTTTIGALWGLGAAAMLVTVPETQSQSVVLVVVAGVAAAAVTNQAAVLSSYLGFLFSTILPLAVVTVLDPRAGTPGIAFLVLVFCATMWILAHRYHQELHATLSLGEEKRLLSEKLADANRQLTGDVDARLRAEALLGIEKTVLENVAQHMPLQAVLDELNLDIEALFPGSLCSVLLLDEDGIHTRQGSAPSLDPDFTGRLNGLAIGPEEGSCGTAMYRREPVLCEDIANDPLWQKYREPALRHGLRACWSIPIVERSGAVLGSFAVYHREPGSPEREQLDVITRLARQIALVIETIRKSEKIETNEQRFRDFASAAGDWFWEMDAALDYTYVSGNDRADSNWPKDRILASTRDVLKADAERRAAGDGDGEAGAVQPDGSILSNFSVSIPGMADIDVANVARPLINDTGWLVGWRGVGRDVTRERQLEREIRYQASHDSLTGLLNRREFDHRIRALLDSDSRSPDQYLAFMDLDRFKSVNDTAGHHAGDKILNQVAQLLRETVPEQATVARLGGDEFGILFLAQSEELAVQAMYGVVNAVADANYEWGGSSFHLGASIGLVRATAAYRTSDQVLSDADQSCYSVKKRGGASVCVFQPELEVSSNDVHSTGELLAALKDSRTLIHVQPIVPVHETTELPWYEVLLRYSDATRAATSASLLIPAVERYNRMGVVDIWVLEHVLETWGARLADNSLRLSLNLSATSITHPDTARQLTKLVEQARVAPGTLCFELTETSALHGIADATRFLSAVHELGCRFMIDNFGSGQTNFSYLKALAADYLAIDGSYVSSMTQDAANHAIVDAIHKVGRAHAMRTLAKNVESRETLDALSGLGVDFAQGNFIGPVVPATELELLLSADGTTGFTNRTRNYDQPLQL